MADSDDFKPFNALQYGGELERSTHTFVDGSDAYANNHRTVISFLHQPSQNSVTFKAFISTFNETCNSDWASERVFGRADPIYMFRQTDRKISLAFKVPAASSGEAYENLGKLQLLAQFLYPAYKNAAHAQTITQSPLIRIKFMNLLANRPGGPVATIDGSATELYNEYVTSANDGNPATGLLGTISSLTFNHNLEGDIGAIDFKGSNTILPKMVDVALEFSVIHEPRIAQGWWSMSENIMEFDGGNSGFPYGAPLYEDPEPAAPTPAAEETEAAAEETEAELAERTAAKWRAVDQTTRTAQSMARIREEK
jgi:hypothetical protein